MEWPRTGHLGEDRPKKIPDGGGTELGRKSWQSDFSAWYYHLDLCFSNCEL